MSYDEKKLESFNETILKDVEKKAKDLVETALKYKKEYIENIKKETLKTELEKTEERISNIRAKYEYEKTKKSYEIKKEILNYRNSLIDKVLENCKNNIKKFSKTTEYELYLIEKINKTFNETTKDNILIKIRKEDLSLETQIKSLDERINLEVDKNIELGGFKLIDKKESIEIDETFETALKIVMQDFYKTSNLNLK